LIVAAGIAIALGFILALWIAGAFDGYL